MDNYHDELKSLYLRLAKMQGSALSGGVRKRRVVRRRRPIRSVKRSMVRRPARRVRRVVRRHRGGAVSGGASSGGMVRYRIGLARRLPKGAAISGGARKSKAVRKPSEYNLFVKDFAKANKGKYAGTEMIKAAAATWRNGKKGAGMRRKRAPMRRRRGGDLESELLKY